MAHIGSEWWQCDRCGYRIQIKDAHGKPYKRVPPTCPSCGKDTKKPDGGPPTKDVAVTKQQAVDRIRKLFGGRR